MKNNFNIFLLPQAQKFLKKLDKAASTTILKDMEISRKVLDAKFFKKLDQEIWEFRSKHGGKQYRTLAFCDRTNSALVVATHGFIKKRTANSSKGD